MHILKGMLQFNRRDTVQIITLYMIVKLTYAG